MSDIAKNLTIVEGPTGAGKSTYIDHAFQNFRQALTVDSNFQSVTKSRFTFDDDTHDKARENDCLKLKKAFNFLSLEDTQLVLIDRLFFSDWVYECIRDHGRTIRKLMSKDSIHVLHLLELFVNFVDCQAQEVGFVQPFQLELVIICPNSYSQLQDRRNSKPDKVYPFASLDWYIYNQFVLAINQYVGRKHVHIPAMYRINDVVITLIND